MLHAHSRRCVVISGLLFGIYRSESAQSVAVY